MSSSEAADATSTTASTLLRSSPASGISQGSPWPLSKIRRSYPAARSTRAAAVTTSTKNQRSAVGTTTPTVRVRPLDSRTAACSGT